MRLMPHGPATPDLTHRFRPRRFLGGVAAVVGES
jgi:hypothetical protein